LDRVLDADDSGVLHFGFIVAFTVVGTFLIGPIVLGFVFGAVLATWLLG